MSKKQHINNLESMPWCLGGMQSISLSDKERECLHKQLVDCINELEVEKNNLLSFRKSYDAFSKLEGVLSNNNRKLVESIISDDHPMWLFFYTKINEALKSSEKYDSEVEPKLLTSISSIPNAENLSSKLISDLENIPKTYSVFLRLPFKGEVEIQTPYSISEGLRIVKADEEFVSKYESKNDAFSAILSGLFPGKPEFKFKEGDYYLECMVEGYVPDSFSTFAIDNFIDLLKSFLGLSLVCGLFSRDLNAVSMPEYEAPLGIYNKGSVKQIEFHSLSREDSKLLDMLVISDDVIKKAGWATQAYIMVNKPEFYNRVQGVHKLLNLISRAFVEGEDARKLRRAGRWYWDGEVTSNDILEFVQKTTVLEILLGEKQDDMSLTKLMSNRCAYLVGHSHKDRKEILDDFDKVYDTRSRILHAGKSRIAKEDKGKFHTLEYMCYRVITKELTLLPKPDGQVEPKRQSGSTPLGLFGIGNKVENS